MILVATSFEDQHSAQQLDAFQPHLDPLVADHADPLHSFAPCPPQPQCFPVRLCKP